MELRHFRYMLALAHHRSFTRAARAVHVTQSTLSHQIRQLEMEIGFELFDRSGREVVLTAAGETLLPGIRRALEDLNEAIRAVRQSRSREPMQLRFLVGARGAARRIVTEALCDPPADWGEISVKIEEVYAASLRQRLNAPDRESDIILGDVQNLPLGWRFEPLYAEDIGLLLPPQHRLARRRRIAVIDLHDLPLVLASAPEPTRLILDKCLGQVGAVPRIMAELNLVDATFELAVANGFAAVAPRNLLTPSGMVYVPLEDPVPQRLIGLICPPEVCASPVVRAVIGRLRTVVEGFCAGKDPSYIIEPVMTAPVSALPREETFVTATVYSRPAALA